MLCIRNYEVITLAAASPGIFPGAILNQDNSANAADNPANSGSIIQIYLTGLPTTGKKARTHTTQAALHVFVHTITR